MAFIETISKEEATGTVKELYEAAEASHGYIPNYLKLFSHRPEVYQAWQKLGASISKNMSLRRYELVTIVAARKLQGTYCMLPHSEALLNKGEVDAEQLMATTKDFHYAQLTDEEVAVMDFAERIIIKSSSVTQADVDHLRSFGISDAEILDITMAAALRCFFSKTLDALNAETDDKYLHFDETLRSALAVGRPYKVVEKA